MRVRKSLHVLATFSSPAKNRRSFHKLACNVTDCYDDDDDNNNNNKIGELICTDYMKDLEVFNDSKLHYVVLIVRAG